MWLIDKNAAWRAAGKIALAVIVLAVMGVGSFYGWNRYEDRKREEAERKKHAEAVAACMKRGASTGADADTNLQLACEKMNFKLDGWKLISAESLNASHPDTFQRPAREKRDSLAPGDAAKLLFDIETREEGRVVDRGVDRMWVKGRTADGYIGVLDNDPGTAENLRLREGDNITFGPEHIAEIGIPPNVTGPGTQNRLLTKYPSKVQNPLANRDQHLAELRHYRFAFRPVSHPGSWRQKL
jgi:hypothetical protein